MISNIKSKIVLRSSLEILKVKSQKHILRKEKGKRMNRLMNRLLRWLDLPWQIGGNLILPLFDGDNLLINTRDLTDIRSIRFPVEEFDRLMVKLGEIGQVLPPFIFMPPRTLDRYGDQCQKLGFVPIHCPLTVLDKGSGPSSEKRDTVDPTLIDFGRTMMPIFKRSGLTHLCLGSADEHFVPLAREAIRFGLKVIVVAGSEESLSASGNLTKLACFRKGKKQIFILKDILK